MQALVICAYPGCGKTFYTDHNPPFHCEDSDSSKFSWKYVEDPSDFNEHERKFIKTDERNPEFPQNYISHIKYLLDKRDVIFVSSHKVVRDALYEAGIPHVIVFPSRRCKDIWLDRLRKRGSDEKFVKFQEDNWDKFHDELEAIEDDDIRYTFKLNGKTIVEPTDRIKSIDVSNYVFDGISVSSSYISSFIINQMSNYLFIKGIDTYPYFKSYLPQLYYSAKSKVDVPLTYSINKTDILD